MVQSISNNKNQSKKLEQFTKLCKGDMRQNSKTARMVLGRYYRVLNFRLTLTRLAILNTWNKNTKTEVASRNNVVHQSLLTPRILQWMPMPMVELHVQACLIFCPCACVQWRDVIVTMTSVGQQQIIHCLWRHQLQRWQRASNRKL